MYIDTVGYYMARRRYEISLRVLKNISRVSASNYFINTNELPNHFTLIVFWCERRDLLCSHSNGDIFTCENNMLFSRVKISCFRAKAHLVFHWCLYNNYILPILSFALFFIIRFRILFYYYFFHPRLFTF